LTKHEKIDDESLETICAGFLRSSLGGPQSEVGIARLRNLTAYNATPEGDFAAPDVMDRSDFVDTEVADTVDGMLPSLMRIFVASDDAVEFEAKKPGGEALAKTITGYINHLFYVRNDGLNVLYDWFKDALIQKVGHVMIWAEEESEDSSCTYEGLGEDQVAMLLQDGAKLDGEPQRDAQDNLTVTVKYEGKRIEIKVAAIAPHEMRIDPNARWGAEPAAIGRVFLKPRFELDEEGVDTSEVGEGDSYQRSYGEALAELGDTQDFGTQEIHASHRPIECAELYLKLDRDGDGIAEWLKVGMVGDRIAVKDGKPDIEKVDDHPFAEICPIPRPHAYFGDCPADRAYEPQRQRTNLTRALLDNVYQSVNQRNYVNTQANVNIDDLLDSRAGGIVRGEGPMANALNPLVQPNLGAPAFQLNEYFKQWSENRTGFNRYSAGTDADAINKTARGVEMLTAKADMRTELIARFFAQGVRKMFSKMLKLSVTHQDKQDWFSVNGQWVPVNPSEWKDQYNVSINVGLGHGTNDQRLQRLMAMMQLQMQGLNLGVVRPEQIANTIRMAATANEFRSPDQFADEKPMGPPPQVQQIQQQAQQHIDGLQQQIQQLQGKAQSQDAAMAKEVNADKDRDLAWFSAWTARLAVIQKDASAAAQVDAQVAQEFASHIGDEQAGILKLHQQAADQQHEAGMAQMQQQHQALTQAADQQHQAGMAQMGQQAAAQSQAADQQHQQGMAQQQPPATPPASPSATTGGNP
jgi:hypothetical protein